MQTSLKFLLASGNFHKTKEFEILFSSIINIVPAPFTIEVEEKGITFEENAFLKAIAYYQKFQHPVMADDSGLIVKSLPEELGIYSARFGGPELDQRQKCELLLKKLENYPDQEGREAYFVCVLCFYLDPTEYYFFEGRIDGHIGHEIRGTEGFGYDPVFIPIGAVGIQQSLAMIPDWKDKNSHRARAAQKAMQFFKERVCQK